MEEELAGLDERAGAADLWNDPEAARKLMQRRNDLQSDVERWLTLGARVKDALELAPLVEDDEDMAAELMREAKVLVKQMEAGETALLLSGDYDDHDALLSIHAGAGGTESQDWAQMLQRMYLRWADQHGFSTQILDNTAGEEAGIKSTTVQVSGRHAYGLLRAERGPHRLVRISPFDASARRHTSFALVEVSPVIDDDVEIDVREEDVRVDIYRASGAGGQHVNKTSSAVRLTHEPSGVVVSCQNERSQAQNRETAWKMLRARLLEKELEKREAEAARLKGQHVEAGWGNQIRSYVLQPYQMVKDHRTSFEVGNPMAVLDGDLDGLIDAWLRWQVGERAMGQGDDVRDGADAGEL
jgi:peptide chain release factor 2